MSFSWNPWHGCQKLSEGCRYCYVYRIDEKYGKDSSVVNRSASFNLPVKRKRDGSYKIPSGEMVYTCFTSDFFVDGADEWRIEAWKMIRERNDLEFFFITKRIDRFYIGLPDDWGSGYDHVTIGCTVENQDRADYRLPIFRNIPLRHKVIICAPLLEALHLENYLDDTFDEVAVGGESGKEARVCNYEWVLDIRRQCMERNIPFWFHQTGAKLFKDGRLYRIKRQFQHSQARKANINYMIKRPI
ncbi:MAG: DUF5131 family protein [Bacteroidales bacterium]|nr:DUF5131 family protein [Bacteroidales bacterium]